MYTSFEMYNFAWSNRSKYGQGTYGNSRNTGSFQNYWIFQELSVTCVRAVLGNIESVNCSKIR